MEPLAVYTTDRRQLIDLTDQVQAAVPPGASGVCVLFLKHTTAALTLAALQDGASEDLIGTLPKLVPAVDFKHLPPEHVPSHLLSAIIGASVSVPLHDGRLDSGDVQRVVLLEFEGPAEREVEVRILGA